MTKQPTLFLFLAIFVTWPATAKDVNGSLVTFRDPTSVRILANQPVKTVRFPVAYVAGVRPDSIKLAVESITRDGLQDEVLDGLFTIKLDSAAPAVTADVTLNAALRPGSYQITLRLDGLVEDSKITQAQQLIITVPAATLRTLGSLVIHQTKGLSGMPSIAGATLSLQETSRASHLTELAVKQLNVESANGIAEGAQLVFDGLPKKVAPGDTAKLSVALQGQFPLGQATGKLEVSASQLAQPYEVTFEVRTAVTKFALVLAIAIGMVIGYLVKTKVTLTMALSEAKLQAADLLHRLQNPAYPDKKFKEALADPLHKLKEAIKGDDPQVISDQQAAAETDLTTALTELKNRQATAQDSLSRLEETLTGRLKLPAPMKSAVQRAEAECRTAQAHLNKGNVGEAETILAKLEEVTQNDLLDIVDTWSRSTHGDVETILRFGLPLSAVLENKKTALQQLNDELEAMPTNGMKDKLAQLLQDITSFRERLYRVLEGTVNATTRLVGDVAAELDGRVDMDDIKDRLGQLREGLIIWQPESLLRAILDKSEAVHTALSKAIRTATNSSIQQDVERLLEKGQYIEAAKKIRHIPQQQPQITGKLLQSATSIESLIVAGVTAPSGSPWSLMPAIDSADLQSRIVYRNMTPITASPTAATIRSEARASLIAAKRWNTVISASLALFAGYLVFEDSFIGSPANFAAAFVWAFGVDASIEVLMGTLRTKLAVPGG